MQPERNPFKVRRAERLHDDQVLSTYCEFPEDLGLHSSSTIILEGARGSGKSTALRILGASPQQAYQPRTADDRLIVGTYLSFGPAWSSAFDKSETIDQASRDAFFAASLNLSLAIQFTHSLRRYIEFQSDDQEAHLDMDIQAAGILASHVLAAESPQATKTLSDLRQELSHCWTSLRNFALRHILGEPSSMPGELLLDDALMPLQRVIENVAGQWGILQSVLWIFALDEVDLLSDGAQRVLNSAMRGVKAPLALKLACLPHGHRTRETMNANTTVAPPHDFEYSAIPTDPKKRAVVDFCKRLYQARRKTAHTTLPVEPEGWVGSQSLRARACHLLADRYGDSTWEDAVSTELDSPGGLFPATRTKGSLRQHVPALAMRMFRNASRGNQKQPAYAGWADMVAVSDGNPRRLLRLLDRMFQASEGGPTVLPMLQDEVIRTAAEGAHNRLLTLPAHGRRVRSLVDHIGQKLEVRLHNGKLIGDSSSVVVDLGQLGPEEGDVIRLAISYGILNPWKFERNDGFPKGQHRYWLSFGLAPKYWLLPRKGSSVFSIDRLHAVDEKQIELTFREGTAVDEPEEDGDDPENG